MKYLVRYSIEGVGIKEDVFDSWGMENILKLNNENLDEALKRVMSAEFIGMWMDRGMSADKLYGKLKILSYRKI